MCVGKKIISNKNKQFGFTIVELLIVIVTIGILAAIVIISYIGLSKKATEASLTSDLDGAKRQLELYKTEHETYPTTMDENKCPTDPINDTKYCLKNKSLEYTTIDNGLTYSLKLTKSDTTFEVTNDSIPKLAEAAPAEPTLPESDWITIGTQRWARKNLNVGTIINGDLEQTDNGGANIIEKYCNDDDEANCTANDNGGLYQWGEAMNYSTTEGAQGICPLDSHIPSDNDWKTLEMYLGMTQEQADAEGWRGSDQGSKMKFGGSSGLNIPLAGYRYSSGGFGYLNTGTNLWSSSYDAWARFLYLTEAKIVRGAEAGKYYGYSVRCLGN